MTDHIRIFPVLPSTNETAKQAARAGAPDGEIVAALAQTAGRGQGDHTFFSPPDTGLYVSRIVRLPLPVGDAVRITTASAVAAVRAIRRATGVQCAVKWINDILLDGRKVAGILTESASDADGMLSWAVVGIGINVYPPAGGFPPEIAGTAAALLPARGNSPDVREALLRALAEEFTAVLPSVASGAYVPEYLRLCGTGKEKAEQALVGNAGKK